MNSAVVVPIKKSRPIPAIFWGGLTAGILDITAAFVTWAPRGISPMRILQGIAKGALGPKAFQGGWKTAALGLAVHFLVAYTATTIFYLASRKIAFLTRLPLASGVLYGIAVYLFMYFVVMPLASLKPLLTPSAIVIAVLTHIFCVGLPISLTVRRYS
ncbi:MAG: hypothetical protein JWO20_2772 [Candidatus Angelobacter sp.]|jgi:uncharacterized membrane protein YagU involved in acid resistance|nr:hypothetical protein [Candidatus Angelobacter sp.]